MTLDAATLDPTCPAAPSPQAPATIGDTSTAPRDLLDAVYGESDEAMVLVDDLGDICYVTIGTTLLLGHDRSAAIGRSVFEFLHPADVDIAADLFVRRLRFDGADLGKELRIRHASGQTLRAVATATLLPPAAAALGLGSCAIRLRDLGDTGTDVTVSLQRRIVVNEYTNSLGADLMAAPGPEEVLARVDAALAEISLLTGADVVAVCLERPNGDGVDLLLSNQDDDDRPFQLSSDVVDVDALFTRHVVIDDLDAREPALVDAFGITASGLLSTPFPTGSRRGALVLLRRQSDAVWWETDSQLARNAANLISRALHTAWSERLLALTYRHGPVAFSIHDRNGDLIDCNDPYLELFGIDRASAGELAHAGSVPEPGRTSLTDLVARLQTGEIDRFDLELEVIRADGTSIWVRTNGVRLGLPGSTDQLVLTSYSDVTSRRLQRLELEHAAHHDPLTGVANRTSLWNAIDEMQRAHGNLPTLLIIDLDRFKHVNDTHGHHVGDRVLQHLVRRLQANVRAGDVVARLGGDEFAIALPGISLADAEDAARRLRIAAEEPIEVDGRSIRQTISIGVASGIECEDVASLMVRADRALYAAKHRGRNCQIVFQPAMRDDVLAEVQLERELQAAIAGGELDVHFQPEFSVADLSIVGAEALVRWHHPTRGLIPAADFIAVAERTGLIDDIGRFALRRATSAFATVCDRVDRPDLKLRLNISAREFARPELSDIVRSAVERSGLGPSRLCLEMTETTLMDAPEIALATFETLHEIGVEFAIDDFGTGYSSLAYLKRFPVDVLKIDRAFIHDIDHDDESRAIVTSILGLARTLALDVVAEGVEHRTQLDVLAELGCERAQGFLVAPALPVEEFTAALSADPRPIRQN